MQRERLLLWVLGTLLALLAVAGVLYAADAFQIRSKLEARIALIGTRVVDGVTGERTVYEYTFLGREVVDVGVTGLVDYVRHGAVAYALTLDPSTRDSRIVELGETNRTLVSGTSTKLWLQVSENNRKLAFGELVRMDFGLPPVDVAEVYDPARWRVRVLSPETGDVLFEGEGSTPRLFEKNGMTHVLFLTPESIRVRDLSDNGAEFSLPFDVDGTWPVEVSADGSYLAIFNKDLMSYEFYEFALTDGRIELSSRTAPEGQLRILSMNGSNLTALGWHPDTETAYLLLGDLTNLSDSVSVTENEELETIRRILPKTQP